VILHTFGILSMPPPTLRASSPACPISAVLQEQLYQSAVLRELEVIGEASRNLSAQLRERYPSVPWTDIVGMRNRIAHGYFAIRMRAVWETVTNDVPVFKRQVEGILADLGSRDK